MRRGRARFAVLLGMLVLLAAPAAAPAGTVSVEGSLVVFTVAPGEQARLTIEGVVGDEFLFIDRNGATAAAPCRVSDSVYVRCPAAGLTGARFTLGDGNDLVSNEQNDTAGQLPIAVFAGGGNDNVLGTRAGDLLVGGPGDDSLAGWFGDDSVSGGPGNDDVRPQDGNDVADGGPGNDWVNGGDGNDRLAAGTGTDQVLGATGNDLLDFRNSEIETKREAYCDDGDDTVVLDESDQVLEQRVSARVWRLDSTCEHVRGQRRPPRPIAVAGGSRRFTVDVANALPAQIKVELVARGKVLARGSARRAGMRTELRMRRTRAGRGILSFRLPVTARVTISDTGGRRATTTHRILASFLL